MSPEELHQRRADLLNEQQLELSELDRKLSDEQTRVERRAVADWEVKYARAKLEMKERHYKVCCWYGVSRSKDPVDTG